MVTYIGTTFPELWQYGSDEIAIVKSTVAQIDQHFADQTNLVINTTWFGSQFRNDQWKKILDLVAQGQTFDNLFLIAVIDPQYLLPDDLEMIKLRLGIRKIFYIGMYENSPYEWNFHAVAVAQHCPQYEIQQLLLTEPRYKFLLYQRKPRLHRIEITNAILKHGYQAHGIITLGADEADLKDWAQGTQAPVLTIEDSPDNYHHNGPKNSFAGIPNDLVSLGRIDIWQQHFVNIVSETEFNNWDPRFITEKTWKPIIGLRPYIIHGQTRIYSWLRAMGFKTFNHYWPYSQLENSEDQHGSVLSVIDFVCTLDDQQIKQMYQDMLPDLMYNRDRYFEFAKEQKHKMHNLFH